MDGLIRTDTEHIGIQFNKFRNPLIVSWIYLIIVIVQVYTKIDVRKCSEQGFILSGYVINLNKKRRYSSNVFQARSIARLPAAHTGFLYSFILYPFC